MNEENGVKVASNESFWTLLDKYKIEIPKMQRNYAQGREEADIKQKRENLINDIFDSLQNGTKLDLNFVYGTIEGNFIPIDGQQRLTTLFLLYWYFMQLSDNINESNISKLSKFTYETKYVTGDFCDKLVKNVKIKFDCMKENNIEKTIKDYYWFFRDFEYDSSIKSMLIMLQAIHEKACEIGLEKCKNYWELLISEECPITFLFLDIDDIGLTDEIYIKMNARGKPLTEFENFKAQLTSYLKKKDEEKFSERILTKMNGEWAQFFWAIQFKNDDKIVFDEQIMNLFKYLMFNEFICNNESHNASVQKLSRYTLKSLRNESTFEFTNRLFKDEFRNAYEFHNEKAVINENTFKKIYKLINALSKRYMEKSNVQFFNRTLYEKIYFDEDEFFNKLINNENLSLEELAILYSEYSFIMKYSDNDGNFTKENELTEWIRYIYNLVKGSLYNQLDDYYRSIKTISFLIENNYALDILNYASNMTKNAYKKRTFGFSDIQAKEDSIKAYLIKNNVQWKKLIIDAENSYLDNQISSILNFSGIENEYDKNMNNYENNKDEVINNNFNIINNPDEYIKKFSEYLVKFKIFFDNNGLKDEFEENSIFRRALLTFGGEKSYLLIREGNAYSFLNNKHRDYGFRRLLRDDNNGKRDYFKQLLDYISNENNVKKELEDKIENFCKDNKTSWKYYFISMPQILNSLKSTNNNVLEEDVVFIDNGRFINMKNSNEILLCTSKSTRSINREYYTYVLFLKARELKYKVFYHKDYRESTQKYLYYNNKENVLIDILYLLDSSDNVYKYCIRKNNEIIKRDNDINNVLEYIKNDLY